MKRVKFSCTLYAIQQQAVKQAKYPQISLISIYFIQLTLLIEKVYTYLPLLLQLQVYIT